MPEDLRAETPLIGLGSQILGTQQDRTVTQSRFSGLPEEEYPDGTVLIWRFEDIPAAYAIRDDRLAAHPDYAYGDARWWTPRGALSWTELRAIVRRATNPDVIVLRAWTTP